MSDAQSGRGSVAPVLVRTKERVKVRRRRSRKERPSALDAERWLAGSHSRSRRMVTFGSGALLLLVIVLYFVFRR
jgi:type II secretory pathway component PulM